MNIEPLTIVKVSADISRGTREMTWGDLGWKIGPKNPVVAKIKAALEAGQSFDLDGVVISTEGKLAKYHMG